MHHRPKNVGGRFGPHLQCEFDLPGGGKDGQILVLGHYDTVYPLGTLRIMPFREADGRLWGPGVLDMKGGLVAALTGTASFWEPSAFIAGVPIGAVSATS